MHTLKVVILDPSRRGRPVTLDELALAVGPRLGLVPRSTQKVVAAPGFGARPFWVDDPDFDLRRHLDERTLPAPGDARSSTSCTASWRPSILPRDRSLWAMTLVHGLEGGRQAVVVRVHHAIIDGLGALNTFLAATPRSRAPTVDIAPPATAAERRHARRSGRRRRATRSHLAAGPRRARRGRRAPATEPGAAGRHPDIPKFLRFDRTSLNAVRRRQPASAPAAASTSPPCGPSARPPAPPSTACSTRSSPARSAAELADRGEDVSRPTIAAVRHRLGPLRHRPPVRQLRHADVRAPAQRPRRSARPVSRPPPGAAGSRSRPGGRPASTSRPALGARPAVPEPGRAASLTRRTSMTPATSSPPTSPGRRSAAGSATSRSSTGSPSRSRWRPST